MKVGEVCDRIQELRLNIKSIESCLNILKAPTTIPTNYGAML